MVPLVPGSSPGRPTNPQVNDRKGKCGQDGASSSPTTPGDLTSLSYGERQPARERVLNGARPDDWAVVERHWPR
jgi:hypothetical protein